MLKISGAIPVISTKPSQVAEIFVCNLLLYSSGGLIKFLKTSEKKYTNSVNQNDKRPIPTSLLDWTAIKNGIYNCAKPSARYQYMFVVHSSLRQCLLFCSSSGGKNGQLQVLNF